MQEVLDKLRGMVTAAREEATFAVACCEAWKPMAYDTDLHVRMGKSFATNTFLTVRHALWREMVIALMRIWDDRRRSINMQWIMTVLQNESVLIALRDWEIETLDESRGIKEPQEPNSRRDAVLSYRQLALLKTIKGLRDELVTCYHKYKIGEGKEVFKHLQRIRHEKLAHRQITAATEPPADWSDSNTADFFTTTMRMVELMQSIALSTHYDLADTGKVYAYHSKLFWLAARGERTEGHPEYKPPSRTFPSQ